MLAQCNIEELKKEMNMNFGDWHLFKSMVRHSCCMLVQLQRSWDPVHSHT